eukprot:GILK01008090.1.p1 GENE.GILK01008090.1~~GILK01008090.1.p1  ORF type:complete len:228 (+),score=36.56 GILK01008090.1:63-746(+)
MTHLGFVDEEEGDVEVNSTGRRTESFAISSGSPSSIKHNVRTGDLFTILASRVYFSKAYSILYATVIVLNALVILWTLFASDGYPRDIWFVLIEICINVAIFGEVVIRMLSQGYKYWQSCSNIFDFFVMSLCFVALCLYFKGPSPAEEVEDLAADMMIGFRNAIQYLRLLLMLKNSKKNQTPNDDIDFTQWNRRTRKADQFVYQEEASPTVRVSACGKILTAGVRRL